MSRKSSVLESHPALPRTVGLITFMLLLAIAAMTYLARATVQGTPPPTHSSIPVPPGLIGDEWTGGPRECDILNGISTACIFLD